MSRTILKTTVPGFIKFISLIADVRIPAIQIAPMVQILIYTAEPVPNGNI